MMKSSPSTSCATADTSLECVKRKRSLDQASTIETKKPRFNWYLKLESESSISSEEDTESVYSIQDKETDVVKDTSDTDTKSESDLQIEVEYDVASSSSNEEHPFSCSSSGSEDMLAAAGAIAAAICDSSLEAWVTDGEDSDNSSINEGEFNRTDFWTCIQCKSQNNNPLFQYCEKCFKVRKNFFPPRPKGHRPRQSKASAKNPSSKPTVKLDNLQSCLKGLSQDSGIGSSLEMASLDLHKIVVPKHLSQSVADKETVVKEEISVECNRNLKRKIQSQKCDATSDEDDDAAPAKRPKVVEKQLEKKTEEVATREAVELPTSKDLCLLCNNGPKNSIFLHGSIAHMCCCYKCAMKTWGTSKRCPVCNCKVKNVVRVFTM